MCWVRGFKFVAGSWFLPSLITSCCLVSSYFKITFFLPTVRNCRDSSYFINRSFRIQFSISLVYINPYTSFHQPPLCAMALILPPPDVLSFNVAPDPWKGDPVLESYSLTDAKSDASESHSRQYKALVVGQLLDVSFPRLGRRHRLCTVGQSPFWIDHEEDDQQDRDKTHERGHAKSPAPVAEAGSDTC